MPFSPATKTREKILRCANVLFAKHGFARTSMEQIASRVGIQKPSLYYFFRSKDDIFAYAMEDVLSRLASDIKSIRAQTALSDTERLARIFERIAASGKEAGAAGAFRTGGDSSGCHSSPQLRSRMQEVFRLVADSMREAGIENPDMAAQVAFDILHSYMLRRSEKKKSSPAPEYLLYVSRLFINKK